MDFGIEKGKIAVLIGTRPEGMKLCPLVLEMRRKGIAHAVISSGQHSDMLREVFSAFHIEPDLSLSPMHFGENLPAMLSHLTCNPDGVGFLWVKRLFVSREYLEGENPDDFLFIQSLVDDNEILMRKNPDYVKQLDSLPEGMRERWRYGSWDVAEGQYFNEFRRDIHVCEPFPLPKEWRRYIAIDYGLDMLAAYWIAVDNSTNCYVYKEYCKPDLPISMAAKAILENTEPNENIYAVLAPPDLWNRSQETGKSKALLFSEAGLDLTKSNNDREAGWLAIKELLAQDAEGNSRLHIFKNCPQLIKNLPELLRDPKHPTDTMNEPHEITHSPDALRYFAIYWVSPSLPTQEKRVKYRKDHLEDYLNAGSEEIRKLLIKKYGGLPEL